MNDIEKIRETTMANIESAHNDMWETIRSVVSDISNNEDEDNTSDRLDKISKDLDDLLL